MFGTGLLLLQIAAGLASPPLRSVVPSAAIGAAFQSYDGADHLSRWGIAAALMIRKPGIKSGLEGIAEGMLFPMKTGHVHGPCFPELDIGCGHPSTGTGLLLVGGVGIYGRDESNPRTKISYGAGLAFRATLKPEGFGPDPGGYFRLEYHPNAARSGPTIGIRYYFFPGAGAGKHLVPLTIGAQF